MEKLIQPNRGKYMRYKNVIVFYLGILSLSVFAFGCQAKTANTVYVPTIIANTVTSPNTSTITNTLTAYVTSTNTLAPSTVTITAPASRITLPPATIITTQTNTTIITYPVQTPTTTVTNTVTVTQYPPTFTITAYPPISTIYAYYTGPIVVDLGAGGTHKVQVAMTAGKTLNFSFDVTGASVYYSVRDSSNNVVLNGNGGAAAMNGSGAVVAASSGIYSISLTSTGVLTPSVIGLYYWAS